MPVDVVANSWADGNFPDWEKVKKTECVLYTDHSFAMASSYCQQTNLKLMAFATT